MKKKYLGLTAWLILMGCAIEVADGEDGGGNADTGISEDLKDVEEGDSDPEEEPSEGEEEGDREDEEGDNEDEEDEPEEEDLWEPGDPPSGVGPFWPGTGRSQYEALLHGDDIYWEAGIQGGHHIWIAVEVESEFFEGLDDDERRGIRHIYRFIHEDGDLLAMASRTGGFRFDEEAGQWQARGLYAVLQAQRRPSRMDGDLIRYTLEVEVGDESYQREVWLVSQCCD